MPPALRNFGVLTVNLGPRQHPSPPSSPVMEEPIHVAGHKGKAHDHRMDHHCVQPLTYLEGLRCSSAARLSVSEPVRNAPIPVALFKGLTITRRFCPPRPRDHLPPLYDLPSFIPYRRGTSLHLAPFYRPLLLPFYIYISL